MTFRKSFVNLKLDFSGGSPIYNADFNFKLRPGRYIDIFITARYRAVIDILRVCFQQPVIYNAVIELCIQLVTNKAIAIAGPGERQYLLA
jgi:hypothetical protein